MMSAHLWPPKGDIAISPKGNQTSLAPVGNGSLSVGTGGQVSCRYAFRAHVIKSLRYGRMGLGMLRQMICAYICMYIYIFFGS